MRKLLCIALSLLTACAVASCGKSSSSQGSTVGTYASDHGENFDRDKYLEEVCAKTEKQEASDEPFSFTAPGELTVPDADAADAELGSYHLSADGVKLYYEDGEYPVDMMLTLEKYFEAYAEGDYTKYSSCVYPSYIVEMEKYLQKEYSYGLKKSFATQCANLAENMHGDFKVKYLKLEKPEQDEDSIVKGFFTEQLNELFGKNYYEEIKAEADKLHYAQFYVIAEGETGEITTLVSAFNIVFAEKDGRFYAFG